MPVFFASLFKKYVPKTILFDEKFFFIYKNLTIFDVLKQK